jgi:hypothetical protein
MSAHAPERVALPDANILVNNGRFDIGPLLNDYPTISLTQLIKLHLKDKVAVISGGSIGIGLAIAEGLANEGTNLLLVAR